MLVLLSFLQRTSPPIVPVLDPTTCRVPEDAPEPGANTQCVGEVRAGFDARWTASWVLQFVRGGVSVEYQWCSMMF